MLIVPIQGALGGGIYCIDAVETTFGDYNLFYNANPPTSSKAIQDPKICAWNQTWTPAGDWPYPPNSATEPVRFVNWCQAQAYCKYNGKHLCGSIRADLDGGADPYAVPLTSFDDFTTNQWFNACSAQGINCPEPSAGRPCYPYGTTYNPALCNATDYVDGGSMVPIGYGPLMTCQGGEPGLYNMAGNVAEWEDSCSGATDAGTADAGTTGASDLCAVRGGSYHDNQLGVRCDSNQTAGPVTQPRDYAGRDVGFRCCL
jgi:formylglycine-generating enzyme required for sulfatase activity